MTTLKDSQKIIRFLTISPIIFIPIVVLMVLLLIFESQEQHFKKTLSTLESDLIISENQAVKAKVDGVVDWVNYQQSIIKENLTNRVQDRVETAHKIAVSIIEQYRDTKSPTEIQKIITTTLRPLIWNSGESFIWILDYNGVFKLAPAYLRHLEGSSIIDFQDATGRYIIQEEIALTKKQGSGFLWDTFTKPDDPSGKQYKQVAYVKALGHYDWYLGSGEYLETAMSTTNEVLLSSIEKIGSKKNYMFVLNSKGEGLLNPSLSEDRTKLDTNDVRIQAVINQHLNKVKNDNSGFLSYQWINPQTNIIEKKYAYVRKTYQKDWLIGSGFYASEIKGKADQKALEIHSDYREKLHTFLLLSVAWVLIALFFGYILSRYIGSQFERYQTTIHHKTVELEQLNSSLENKVQERTAELEESKKAYKNLAKTDALTGICNRYSIMRTLEKEIQRAHRTHHPFAVMMFDLDYFKPVNDRYGHDIGDQVLQSLTQVVKPTLRKIDSFGRYGGDEFIIILPETDIQSAHALSDRIRNKVEQHRFENVGHITISAGIVVYQDHENLAMLFKRLDQKLYEAKENRNHIAV